MFIEVNKKTKNDIEKERKMRNEKKLRKVKMNASTAVPQVGRGESAVR